SPQLGSLGQLSLRARAVSPVQIIRCSGNIQAMNNNAADPRGIVVHDEQSASQRKRLTQHL
ncbi:MAG: hypothetical protein ACRCVX_06715, partial [Shewanella sp.]